MTTRAGAKIRTYREAHSPKLTRMAFGARYGIPGSTVANWETDGKIANPDTVRRLAAVGICTPADWYHPALCTLCELPFDAPGVAVCTQRDCPLNLRQAG